MKEFLKYDIDLNEHGLIFFSGRVYITTILSRSVYYRAPPEAIKILLDKGADPSFNVGKIPPLYLAVVGNNYGPVNPETIQLLLNYKADITLKDRNGETAFDILMKNTHIKKTDKYFQKLMKRLNPKKI